MTSAPHLPGLDAECGRLIAARFPVLAAAWLALVGTTAAVLALETPGRAAPAGLLLGVHALVLGIAAVALRMRASDARAIAVGACLGLVAASSAGVAAIGGTAEVLAVLLLALHLLAASLFAWGWRTALALVGATLALGLPALPWVGPAGSPLGLAVATALGAGLALAVAEGGRRGLELAHRRPASEEALTRELRPSRDAYQDLAENARDLIWTCDLEGRFTYANAAVGRVLGVPPAELSGRSLEHFVSDHPDNRETMRIAMRIREGVSLPPLLSHVRTVVGARWMEAVLSPIRDPDGTIVGVRGISRDIHERRLAEEKLRESEERFRAAFTHASIGMAVVATDGRALQVNPTLCAMLGYAEHEMLGRPFSDVTHPDDVRRTAEAAQAALRGECDSYQLEKRYLRKDGRIVWGQLSGAVVRDASGRPLYLVAQIRDVTEHRRAERALRASEARFRVTFGSAPVGLGLATLDQRIVQVNPAFCRMTGYDEATLTTMTIDDVTHPDDRGSTGDHLRRLLAGAIDRYVIEKRYRRRDGSHFWAETAVALVRGDDGAPLYTAAHVRDISERRSAEQALHASLGELRESEERLRRLAQRQVTIREQERKRLGFDLHDDVCQELIGIGILVESVRQRLGPISTEVAAEIDRVGRYLAGVIEHLRLLARDLRPLLLGDLGLEGGLRSLASGMATSETHLSVLFPTRIPRLEEEVEVAFYRVAQEALGNAVRHARARSIVLTLAADEGWLRLEVRDDGAGFDPATTEPQGVGLVSMEERALALGGRLEIRSRPGGGTTLRFACPLSGCAPASAA